MTNQVREDESSTSIMQLPWAAAFNSATLGGLTRTTETCNRAYVNWQQEMVRSTTNRWQSDSQIGQQLLSCKNWVDMAKMQGEWASSMMHDYLDEANRMSPLAAKFAAELIQWPTADAQTTQQHEMGSVANFLPGRARPG